jgi:competence protein ComEA
MMRRKVMALMTIMTVALMMAWAVPVLAEEAAPSAAKTTEMVNINTATLDQLMTLDGIGESYAKRIIEYRQKNGPFQSAEDLLKVKGIGEKTLNANQGRIVVKDSKNTSK